MGGESFGEMSHAFGCVILSARTEFMRLSDEEEDIINGPCLVRRCKGHTWVDMSWGVRRTKLMKFSQVVIRHQDEHCHLRKKGMTVVNTG